MFRKNTKTVNKSVGARGMFGKIMSRFKTKPKIKVSKITKPPKVTIQKKITPTKTKNGNDRKEVSHTNIDQVRKLFAVHKENPNLSAHNIGSIVNMSGELVRYYLGIGKLKAIGTFKKKDLKIKTKLKKADKRAKKNLKKEKSITILTEKKAGDNLDTLFKTEKYPIEHQSDPRYFSGTEPPQSVATEENFAIQKRKNVINRAVVAKKIAKDKAEAGEFTQEKIVLERLRKRHENPKTKPKIHYSNCPSCNPNSTTPLEVYQAEVTRESLRRHDYAQNKLKLMKKEKELDEIIKSKEPTVAERTQEGTKLCRTCDSVMAYSQASRSFSIYREYYCRDHEPKL